MQARETAGREQRFEQGDVRRVGLGKMHRLDRGQTAMSRTVRAATTHVRRPFNITGNKIAIDAPWHTLRWLIPGISAGC
ncbi:MAG: hypothetical protein ACRERX_12485 [Pseudomonas sp.]